MVFCIAFVTYSHSYGSILAIFNDCRILCIELPDDGPYVTETCSVWKYIFVVSTVLLFYTFVAHNRMHIMKIKKVKLSL
jgi:hypothetical protein